MSLTLIFGNKHERERIPKDMRERYISKVCVREDKWLTSTCLFGYHHKGLNANAFWRIQNIQVQFSNIYKGRVNGPIPAS